MSALLLLLTLASALPLVRRYVLPGPGQWAAALAAGFGASVGGLTLWMLVLGLLPGPALAPLTILLFPAALWAWGLWLAIANYQSSNSARHRAAANLRSFLPRLVPVGWPARILLLAAGAALAVSLAHTLYYPFVGEDEVSRYAYYARLIFDARSIPLKVADYPLLLPLGYAYAFFISGGANEHLAKIVSWGFAPATVAATYWLASLWAGRRSSISGVGLLAAFTLAVTRLFVDWSPLGYVDIPSGLYFALAGGFVSLWIQRGQTRHALAARGRRRAGAVDEAGGFRRRALARSDLLCRWTVEQGTPRALADGAGGAGPGRSRSACRGMRATRPWRAGPTPCRGRAASITSRRGARRWTGCPSSVGPRSSATSSRRFTSSASWPLSPRCFGPMPPAKTMLRATPNLPPPMSYVLRLTGYASSSPSSCPTSRCGGPGFPTTRASCSPCCRSTPPWSRSGLAWIAGRVAWRPRRVPAAALTALLAGALFLGGTYTRLGGVYRWLTAPLATDQEKLLHYKPDVASTVAFLRATARPGHDRIYSMDPRLAYYLVDYDLRRATRRRWRSWRVTITWSPGRGPSTMCTRAWAKRITSS